MAPLSTRIRGGIPRGMTLGLGTLTSAGATPFANSSSSTAAILNSSLSGTIGTPGTVTLTGGFYGYVTGGTANVPTLLLLNNGSVKQVVKVSSGSATAVVQPTSAATISLSVTGINETTYQATFSTGATTCSLIPAEFVANVASIGATDTPPTVGGNCTRYTVAVPGLPNVSVDLAESTHPAAAQVIVLNIAAEVQPYSGFASYNLENQGTNIVQNTVNQANGVFLGAQFPGNNAWNAATSGLSGGQPMALMRLAARYMALISFVYNQYCLPTGSKYPSGASGTLPFYLWVGSGSCGGVMACMAFYGLGNRPDIVVTEFLFDSPGAGILTYREMSGLLGDIDFNPTQQGAGSSGLPEANLAVQASGRRGNGNYNPSTLLPLFPGEGISPPNFYMNLASSLYGPSSLSSTPGASLTVNQSGGYASLPSTMTFSGTATNWPVSSGRDVTGTGTCVTSAGTLQFCYNNITAQNFEGVSWPEGASATIANGAAIAPPNGGTGYTGTMGGALANQVDGPFALPPTTWGQPSGGVTRLIRFIMGQNDVSALPPLLLQWMSTWALAGNRFIWMVVPGASHNVAGTAAGAAAIQSALFNAPVPLQGAGSTTVPSLPGAQIAQTNNFQGLLSNGNPRVVNQQSNLIAFVTLSSLATAIFASTVAAGSNGGNIANIATWATPAAGQLAIASATSFSSGQAKVTTSTGWAIIAYTGKSGNNLTGCTLISGGGTVSTGGSVTQGPIIVPSGWQQVPIGSVGGNFYYIAVNGASGDGIATVWTKPATTGLEQNGSGKDWDFTSAGHTTGVFVTESAWGLDNIVQDIPTSANYAASVYNSGTTAETTFTTPALTPAANHAELALAFAVTHTTANAVTWTGNWNSLATVTKSDTGKLYVAYQSLRSLASPGTLAATGTIASTGSPVIAGMLTFYGSLLH